MGLVNTYAGCIRKGVKMTQTTQKIGCD